MSGVAYNQNALFRSFDGTQSITLDKLCAATDIVRHEAIKATGKLIERGLVSRLENGLYVLTAVGLEAKNNGHEIKSGPIKPDRGSKRKPWKNTLRQRAWSAMRIMPKFSARELVAVASDNYTQADHQNLQRYCRALESVGILAELPTREQGTADTSNGFKRYRLVTDTGDSAPIQRIRSGTLFDPNTQEVFKCQI